VEITTTSPDAFIEGLPEKVRSDVEKLDALIQDVMAGQSRVMWEGKFWGGSEQRIIGYGDYSQQRPNKKAVEWFIIGLAVQKDYISLYVTAADEDGYLVKKYGDRLGKVKVGSSAISFKSAHDIDLDVLAELLHLAKDG
jgi:hypothetical protein